MKAKLVSKDQDYQNESTTYWFEIIEKNHRMEIGDMFGVVDCGGELSYVDCDGAPVDQADEIILKNIIKITDEMINDY